MNPPGKALRKGGAAKSRHPRAVVNWTGPVRHDVAVGAFVVVLQAIMIGAHIVQRGQYWRSHNLEPPALEFSAFGLLIALVIGIATGLPGLLTATIGFVKAEGRMKLVALFGGLGLYLAASFIPYLWR